MNTREQLNQYLRGLETRLRWMTVSKGAAIAAGVALGATIALVLITNALALSDAGMTAGARPVLFSRCSRSRWAWRWCCRCCA